VKKLLSALAALAVALGLAVVAVPLTASAHTPVASATCETLSVNLTQYQPIVPAKDATYKTVYQRYSWTGGPVGEDGPGSVPPGADWQPDGKKKPGDDPIGEPFKQGHGQNASWFFWVASQVIDHEAQPAKVNTVTVFIDGVQVDSQQFGTSFSKQYSLGDKYVAHDWRVVIDAYDGSAYDKTLTGTSTPCERPQETPKAQPIQPTADAGIETCVNGESVDANGTIHLPAFEGGHWAEHAAGDITDVPPGDYFFEAVADEGYELVPNVIDGVETNLWEVIVPASTDVECQTPPPTNQVCEVVTAGPVSTDLNDLWADVDTRSAGHHEYVDGALRVYTDDSSPQAKVSEGLAVSFPLYQTGALAVNATPNPGNSYPNGPGLNLFVDFDHDGDVDGTLVYENVYGQDLWLTGGSAQFVKDAAPVVGGGNGSQWHGTIDQWLTAFPEAQVSGIAYALGSGVHGDWNLVSITVNCTTYTFDVVDLPVIPEPEVEVTYGEYGGDEPTCENPSVEWTRTKTTVTTPYKVIVVEGAYQVVLDPENATTVTVTDEVTETHEYDGECETTPPTTPPAPSGDKLAETGVDDPFAALYAGVLIALLGLAFVGAVGVRKLIDRKVDRQ